MSAEPSAILASLVCVLCGVVCYQIGKRTAAQDHDAAVRDAKLRGCRMGAEGGRVMAQSVAREWINRPQWPMDDRANVQRWKELGRREAYAMCADRLCRAFNIETPSRTVNNS